MTQAVAYAAKLFELADQILKTAAKGENYLYLVEEAEDQIQGLIGDAYDYEIVEHQPSEVTTNLVDLPEGHKFVLYRHDQVNPDGSWFGGRLLSGFVESFESLEEAYQAARGWEKLPAYVAEASQEENGAIRSKLVYIYTDKAAKDQAPENI